MPLLILLLVALATAPREAAAQSPAVPLRDYIHTVWTQHDGVPLTRVRKILQTSDGYLWVITREEGLMRFDGMRFVLPTTPCRQPVLYASSAPDGGFWAICGNQLVRRTNNGQFVEVPQDFIPLKAAPPLWLIVDRLGRPWFFFEDTVRYLEADGTGGHQIPRPTSDRIRTVAMDADGTLWASDTRTVVHVSPDRTEVIELSPVWCLVPARGEGVFALSGERAWRLRNGSAPLPLSAIAGIGLIGADSCVAEAADGGLWIGTDQHGLALLQNGGLETRPDSGEIERSITAVFIDREGSIWAGATAGLHRFRKPIVQLMTSASRHLTSAPAFLFVDSRQNLWLSPGDNRGVSRLSSTDSTWTSVRLREHEFWAIGEDKTGRIWLSDTRNIGYVADGTFVTVRDEANAPIRGVSSFRRDGRGELWAGASSAGVYRITPGPPRLVVESPDASSKFLVSSRFGTWITRRSGGIEQHVDGRVNVFPEVPFTSVIIEDSDSIWIGTSGGLRRWRHGKWTIWTQEHGLLDSVVGPEIMADRLGRFWIMTPVGLLVMPRAQLDATPDGSPRQLSFARIGTLDGIVPPVSSSAASPLASADLHGRLYFATLDSAVMVDPSAVTESSLPPPIVIEGVTADQRSIDLAAIGSTGIAPLVEPSRVQFDYTSLSLRNPEYARFRYRLEGFDQDWVDAGLQRRVIYGTLRPGSYRFRVIGAGSEGVWNDVGATFAFQVAPVFWRTWWFRTMLLGFGSLVVAGLYQLRVRQLQRQFDIALDARVNERTRIARELHDTLLQTFQGVVIHFQAATNLLPARPDDAKRKLDRVLDQAAGAITEGRDAVQALRSTAGASDDLAKAIGVLGGELAREAGDHHPPAVRVHVEGTPRILRPVLRDDVYRIASEALRNAMHHAGADLVQVDIHYGEGHLRVRIRDDGKGIDAATLGDRAASGHWGLPGMRERAELIGGVLDVRSRLGSGTEVDLSLPASRAYTMPPAGRRFWPRKTRTEANV